MATENQNSENQSAQTSNNAGYGEQGQAVFEEMTEQDEKTGLAAALKSANVSYEDSIFYDEDQDDLYDDEYNYTSDDESMEEEPEQYDAYTGDNFDDFLPYDFDNEPISSGGPLYASGFSMLSPEQNKPQNSFEIYGETLLDDLTFDDDKTSPDAVPEKEEQKKPEPEKKAEQEADPNAMSFGTLEPITGVVFENIQVAPAGGLSLEGSADLMIDIPNPEVTGEAAGISITLDPQSKKIDFSVPSLTLNTAIGDIEVTELSLEDGELKATEAHFTFDSSKTSLGALISGDAESEVSNLFALGVVVDVTGHNISISKEKGFEIESLEKKLTDLKLRVFGEDFEYDAEEGKAELHKEYSLLEYLTGEKEIEKEMKIPLFAGSEIDLKAALQAEDAATLDILIEKPGDDYEFTITGDFGGLSLNATAEGNAKIGFTGLSAQGEFSAQGNITPEEASIEGKGSFKAEENSGIIMPIPSSFDLSLKLVLPVIVNLMMKLSASILFYTKNIEKELTDHELAKFNIDKAWNKTFGPEEPEAEIAPEDLFEEMETTPIMDKKSFKSLF